MVVDFCACVEIDAFGPNIFESRNQKLLSKPAQQYSDER